MVSVRLESIGDAKYLKADVKAKTTFECLESYLKKQNIFLGNIPSAVIYGSPGIVGCYRGFATLLKQKVSNVRTVHRHQLETKKLSGKLKSV